MDLSRFVDSATGSAEIGVHGRLRSVIGTSLQATVPGARIGELVDIERPDGSSLTAEIVGFREELVSLMPLGSAAGLAVDARLTARQAPMQIRTGMSALGRVLDGLGQPIDGRAPINGELRELTSAAPEPMSRPPIQRPIEIGIRAIDAIMTIAEGQRMGIFAAAGAGKSQLLAQCARGSEADAFVVALIGERGRELREFIDRALGIDGLARGVVVCATSDAPPLVRMKSALVAMTHAEALRAAGNRVLLLVDSITRFARAARDVGLASGELPVRRGYPPSVFASLPPLLERCGRTAAGSITALCTVLVEGEDHDEPIADELRGLLDGHIVLSRTLATGGHFPAIDVLQSLSRCMPQVVSQTQLDAATALRTHLARYRDKQDLVSLGAYRPGSDPALDDTLARMPAIESFLRQAKTEHRTLDDTVAKLAELVSTQRSAE